MRRGYGGLLVWLFCCWAAVAQAADFQVERVCIAANEAGEVLLDADIAYHLSDTALEALDNGVPLTFVVHLQVRDDDAWIWEPDVVDARLRFQLRYHPLSSLYELRDLGSGNTRRFATRAAALSALGELRDIPVVEQSRLEKGHVYQVRLEAYLDIEALPLPLRPLAHISPEWHLESDPWEWQLRP